MKQENRGLFLVIPAGAAAFFLILWLLGIKPYVVTSGSMYPAVQAGSLTLVNTRASFDSLCPGDVIAFRSSLGGMVIHRAVRFEGAGAVTKGDANSMEDGERVKEESFAGRAVLTIPYLGYVFAFAGTACGKFILTGIIVFAAGWILLGDRIKSGNEKRRET